MTGRPQRDAGLACRDLVATPGRAVVLRRLSLEVPTGTRTVVVGPSGAGKTTLLRTIAGLQPLLQGEIWLAKRRLDRLPTHRRQVAVVFQEPRLLPHLRVIDNVAFGLRAARVPRGARHTRTLELLDEVGLASFAHRHIDGLSGGEQQRVALARALCAQPDLLLLDEPLASIDPGRRESLRRLLVELQRARGLTTLLITHDQTDTAQLGERVALLLDGTIVQHDTPQALFERPTSAAVARFFGTHNLLGGQVASGRLTLGGTTIQAPGPNGKASYTIRPERVRLDPRSPLRLQVTAASYAGTHLRLDLHGDGLSLDAHVPTATAPRVGEVVGVTLPPDDLWRLPDGDQRPEAPPTEPAPTPAAPEAPSGPDASTGAPAAPEAPSGPGVPG